MQGSDYNEAGEQLAQINGLSVSKMILTAYANFRALIKCQPTFGFSEAKRLFNKQA